MLNDESWLTGLDDGRGVPTDISSANQTHHNKKIRIGDVIPTLILYELKFCHRTSKRGVEIQYQDFPYLILWSTENDGPFVAIEPWSGLSTCDDEDDVFEHKRGVMKAAPGERKQLTFSIQLL